MSLGRKIKNLRLKTDYRVSPFVCLEDKELGRTSLIKHKIRLDNNIPFKERHRRIPPHQYEEVRKHLQEMLEMGAIQRSHSPGQVQWSWCERKQVNYVFA